MRTPTTGDIMSKKNANSKFVGQVASGLISAWKSYKRTAMHRHATPFESLMNDLFGREVSDVEAALYLAQDIDEIRSHLQQKKIDKEFNKIIKNSF